jgi:hypothetical protein
VSPDINTTGSLSRTREWLRHELADGPKLRLSLQRLAQAQGYNASNLDMAAKQLDIVSDRVRVDGEGWRARWTLPPENAHGRHPVNPLPGTPTMTEDDAPKGIADQLAQLQTTSRLVDIYRVEDGELAFLDSMLSTECKLSTIKRRYGGGDYNIEGVRVRISGRPVADDGVDTALRPRGSPAPVAAVAAGGFDMQALVMMLIKSQSDMLAAVLAQKPAGGDPVAMFTAVDNAVARRLESAPAAPDTPVDQALKLLREGMALGRAAEGIEPEDGGFGRVIEKVAPFLNVLAAKIGQPSAVPTPEPTPVGGSVVPKGMPVTALHRVLADLAPSLPDLLNEAKKGTPPETVAAQIHANCSDEQYDALAEAADAPQFVDDLMEALAPHLAPLKAGWAVPWLRKAAESLNGLLVADRGDDAEPSANGGERDGATVPSPAGTGRPASPDRVR